MSTDQTDLEAALRRTLAHRARSVPGTAAAHLLDRLPATTRSRRPRRRGVGWLAAAGAAAATAVAIGVVASLGPSALERPVETPQPPHPAFDREPVVLGGETLDRTSVSTRDYAGRPLLVVFWGSWCDPCRDQVRLVEEYVEGSDVDALGVASRDRREHARAAEEQLGLSYPSILDGTRELSTRLGIRSYPVTVLLGGDGRMIQTWYGPTTDLSVISDALDATAGDTALTVSRETYGPAWPLTVDDGVLRCEAGRVPVLVADGRWLALEAPDLTDPLWDAVARGGYHPAIDDLRDEALHLCRS